MSATVVDGPSMERFSRPIASRSGFVSRSAPPSHSSTRPQSTSRPAGVARPKRGWPMRETHQAPNVRADTRVHRADVAWLPIDRDQRRCRGPGREPHGRDDVPELTACLFRKGVEADCLGDSGHQERVGAGRTHDVLALNVVPGGAQFLLDVGLGACAHADDVDAGNLQRRPQRSAPLLAVLITHHVDVGDDLQRSRRGRGLDLLDELVDGPPHGRARNVVRLVGDGCGCDGGFKESVAIPPRIVHSRVDCPACEPVRECCLQRLRQRTVALNGVSEIVASDLDPRPMLGSWDYQFLSQDLERLSQCVSGERAKRRLVLGRQRKSCSLLRAVILARRRGGLRHNLAPRRGLEPRT